MKTPITNSPAISIVLPCYNEVKSIDDFFKAILPILKKIELPFEIICINDGSKDNTLEKLILKKSQIPEIKIIDFSKNFGKDAAMTAGLNYASGNCVIPMDCDLQDPPELIIEMVKQWQAGSLVVLARREDRSDDTLVKRTTAGLFYKIFNMLSDLKIPENVGDFRLMDRKVVDIIKTLPERKRFMKGLFAFVGFEPTYIGYKRPERLKGKSKWNYWKLWNYALDGVTSFSSFPLKISMYFGLLITILAFTRGSWILLKVLWFGIDVPGYASLMTAILFFGGVQLMSIGIIGEYVGRIYTESKQRPIYVIKQII